MTSTNLWRLVGAVLLLGATACDVLGPVTALEDCVFSGREALSESSPSPLQLVACQVPERDSPDGSRRNLLVLLLNDSPSALTADEEIELGRNLFVEVIGEDGEPPPVQSDLFNIEPMPLELDLFPRFGVRGRFIDLGCEMPGHIVLERGATCLPVLDIQRPGNYEVVFQARVHWCLEVCERADAQLAELRSRPVSVELH